MSTAGPLASLRVLDLSSVGPAARAARILADYGADLIKIGPAGASGARTVRAPAHAYGAGRGMRALRIDLKDPTGRDAFLRLAERSDVVLESFRPGVVKRLGIDYPAVCERNRRIVYCSTSGYGQSGPYAERAGHDLNYLAVGGFLHCSGRRADGGPALPGATVADAAAGGMHAVIAILAALWRRERTGEGAYLDVSVTEGVLHLMALQIDEYLATGRDPGPGSGILSGRFACYDTYRARDGKWLAVAAIEPAFFARLCQELDLEQWIPYHLDEQRQEELRAALRARFAERDRDEWVERLAARDTCVAPVYAIDELCRDPHLRARGAFIEVEHPERGRLRQVGPVLAGCPRPEPGLDLARPPEAGAALLAEAGLAPSEIEALRARGVVEWGD